MEERQEKHVHKALAGGKPVEKTKFEKAVGLFLAEDASMVSDSIMDDFIKPRLKEFGKESILKVKEFVADSLIGCIQMIIFGKTSKKNGTYYTSGGSHVNYVTYYDGQPVNSTNYISTKQPVGETYGLTLYSIESYGKAVEVLEELRAIIRRYKHASVADYYQLLSIAPSKTDWNFGWFDLEGVAVTPYRDGRYILNLPKPVSLGG